MTPDKVKHIITTTFQRTTPYRSGDMLKTSYVTNTPNGFTYTIPIHYTKYTNEEKYMSRSQRLNYNYKWIERTIEEALRVIANNGGGVRNVIITNR